MSKKVSPCAKQASKLALNFHDPAAETRKVVWKLSTEKPETPVRPARQGSAKIQPPC